jgi:hypothetical protein
VEQEEILNDGFSVTITVYNSVEEAFAGVMDLRGWWLAEPDGEFAKVGDTFVFDVPGAHCTNHVLTELVPNERVVWRVSEGWMGFVKDTTEWDGTDTVFEVSRVGDTTQVRFTHVGLVPSLECFVSCSTNWHAAITGSLRDLITTGTGNPHPRRAP